MSQRKKTKMKERFTQGTIIESMRSGKYPGIRCKGIVISARCDLAQNKIKYFHCLMALPLEDWFFEVLFNDILEEKKKELFGKIKRYAEENDLDFDSLINMGIDKVEYILTQCVGDNKKKSNDISIWISTWKTIEEFSCEKKDRNHKNVYLRNNAEKLVKSKMQQLYNSAYPKFAFVPVKAYSCNSSSVEGLVIDLQDIKQIDMNVKNDILDYKYDFSTYQGDRKEEINKLFFFENESDFVMADGIITSPWIEYILQLFAHSFIRIGVDNAFDYEIREYCNRIMEANT